MAQLPPATIQSYLRAGPDLKKRFEARYPGIANQAGSYQKDTAATAAQAPAAAPAPAPAAPAPFYGDLDQADAAALKGLNTSLADLGYDEGQIQQTYGLVDHTDPFSKAAQLERSFQQKQSYNTNSYAARGQLYSGALGNARTSAQYGHDQSYDALTRDYQNQLETIKRKRRDVNQSYENTLGSNAQSRIYRALGING